MRESRVTSVLNLGALLVLSVVVVSAGNQIAALDGRIAKALNKRELPMQTLSTVAVRQSTWDSTTIVSTRNDGESNADFIARHNKLVDDYKAS